MPRSFTTNGGLKVDLEDPSKYDSTFGSAADKARQHDLMERLNYPELKIGSMSSDTGKILRVALPIIKKRRPRTIEYANCTHKLNEHEEPRRLRGVIIRDANGTVLLYAYGIGFDAESVMHRARIFKEFGLELSDDHEIKDAVWPNIDYSVVITLP